MLFSELSPDTGGGTYLRTLDSPSLWAFPRQVDVCCSLRQQCMASSSWPPVAEQVWQPFHHGWGECVCALTFLLSRGHPCPGVFPALVQNHSHWKFFLPLFRMPRVVFRALYCAGREKGRRAEGCLSQAPLCRAWRKDWFKTCSAYVASLVYFPL